MYFYNRELDLLQPFRLRWYKNTTALISYGVAIRYICCSPSDWCGMPERLPYSPMVLFKYTGYCHMLYMLQSFGLVWYA